MLSLCKYLIEMEAQQKKAELDKKAYDDLVRERDILSKVCEGVECVTV